jgi:hypothetical protein
VDRRDERCSGRPPASWLATSSGPLAGICGPPLTR